MIIWICTDMEGLAGIDHWDQCYDPDDNSPKYRYGLEQLTAEVNAAVAGCFDGGATEVRVLDGHGRNQNKGFLMDRLDKRVKKMWVAQRTPLRWEGLDESVAGVAVIGQHAMAGTVNGFLDHTQCPKTLCRFTVNGREIGEPHQLAIYAGAFGIPVFYLSGDEALCAEAKRDFPYAITTPTKRGTGWNTCELYPPDQVRANIRRDISHAIQRIDKSKAMRLNGRIDIAMEMAYSGLVDWMAAIPGVRRPHARTASWTITDPRDIYSWPGDEWQPTQS